MDELSPEQNKEAAGELRKLEHTIEHLDRKRLSPIQTTVDTHLTEIGVPPDIGALADIGHVIGFVTGRLHAKGASLEQIHDVIKQVRGRRIDDYEVRVYGDDAGAVIRGMDGVQLQRLARLLRAAVLEVYLDLVDALPDVDKDELYKRAVGVAEVFVDIMHPLIAI